MYKFRGSSIRLLNFNDTNVKINISGNGITESDVDKVQSALVSATVDDTAMVVIGRINRYENDQYLNEITSIDKTSQLQTRKMILTFEDSGALVVRGKFPMDQDDLNVLQGSLINKTLGGEKITGAVLGI